MTADEHIKALAMHLEVLRGVHEDLEKRHEEFEKTLTNIAVEINDAIKRLTTIAEAHEHRLDDLEQGKQ
jgi:hypothetical protein